MAEYRCCICAVTVPVDGTGLPELYPFCSERCRWVDLGRWLSEEYSLERDLTPEDIADVALPPTDDVAGRRTV